MSAQILAGAVIGLCFLALVMLLFGFWGLGWFD
jgi:hypothetical protein